VRAPGVERRAVRTVEHGDAALSEQRQQLDEAAVGAMDVGEDHDIEAALRELAIDVQAIDLDLRQRRV
jgi:hypothetical protein